VKKAIAIFEIPDYLVEGNKFVQITRPYAGDEKAVLQTMLEDLTDELCADSTDDFQLVCIVVSPSEATEVLFEEDL
jgi:hypothetical protein